MTVRCLIFLSLFPIISYGQDQFYGTRVNSLSLVGAANDGDLNSIPLHVGDILSPANVRDSIQALYNIGRYSYVEVDAVPDGGGSRIAITVRPYSFFSTFRLEPENVLDR